jgi:hypothetical protein
MNFGKLMKKIETSHIVMLVAAVALVYVLFSYSRNKSLLLDGMTSVSGADVGAGASGADMNADSAAAAHRVSNSGNPQPSLPLGQNTDFAKVAGSPSPQYAAQPSCATQPTVDPAELLPVDHNNEWSKLNPMGHGDLKNVSLLKAGYHIGRDTVASSLRNANLQLRSEPANPQVPVGPWNNTTISPDHNRVPFEIGSCM